MIVEGRDVKPIPADLTPSTFLHGSLGNPLVTGEIGVGAYASEAHAHKQVANCRALFPAVFQDQPAAGHQVRRSCCDDRVERFETRD